MQKDSPLREPSRIYIGHIFSNVVYNPSEMDFRWLFIQITRPENRTQISALCMVNTMFLAPLRQLAVGPDERLFD